MLSEKERRKIEISLCFIDVNGLKQVNDILGHKMGDELLQSVTAVIQSAIRENDFVARMGGDEFIIVFSGIGKEVAEKIWDRICDIFKEINETENRPYAISVSHGIVSCDKDSKQISADEFIKQADALMYKQKRVMKQGLNVIRK
jgi:diguanylate cyclase (GGDEF)-like protein